MRHTCRVAAAIGLALLTLASACSQEAPAPKPLSHPAPPSTEPPSTTAAAARVTPATDTTPTSTWIHSTRGNGPECSTKSIAAFWPDDRNGASGVLYYSVDVRNVAAVACHMAGYFGVSAFAPSGALVAASDTREADLGSLGPVVLTPGSVAHFQVGFQDSNLRAGGIDCHTVVGSLHLIPPDQTTSVQVATPDARSNGRYPPLCERKIFVGPVTPNRQ